MNDKIKEVIIEDVEINNLLMKKDDNKPSQDGQFELVDEVNARQTHKNLVEAVKSGDVDAVRDALKSGANTSYDEPTLLHEAKQDMTHVAQDFVINKGLLKSFQGDAIVGDIHGPMSESQMTMFLLHEMAHMEAGNIARKSKFINPEAQVSTEAYKTAAKEVVEQLGLTFVKPAALRKKFNSVDKKDKNTPK